MKCHEGNPAENVRDLIGLFLQISLMPDSPSNKKRNGRMLILGVGLDTDGHKRLTMGATFALVGGKADTHERMTETVLKMNEKLAARGKPNESVTAEEMDDIAASVGLDKVKTEQQR